jgi:flagellar biosynthesis protein FliQ
MTESFVIDLGIQAIKVVLLLSLPLLGFGLVVGLIISIFQAVTSIQEMTLTFVPKILAVLLALVLFGHWMLQIITGFEATLLNNLPNFIR